MSRDPLPVLARVRGAAANEARRALAAALTAERRCEEATRAARARLRDEQAGAGSIDALAMLAWLPHARQRIADAAAAQAGAAAEVAKRRADLAAARAAEEAVRTLMRERDGQAALQAARREQAVLDEAAARTKRWRPS
jgi:flagellar export protein FliJ